MRRRRGGLSDCRVVWLLFGLCVDPFFGFMSGNGEEGVGEHGQGDVSVPGVPGADLVVVQPRLRFLRIRSIPQWASGPRPR